MCEICIMSQNIHEIDFFHSVFFFVFFVLKSTEFFRMPFDKPKSNCKEICHTIYA